MNSKKPVIFAYLIVLTLLSSKYFFYYAHADSVSETLESFSLINTHEEKAQVTLSISGKPSHRLYKVRIEQNPLSQNTPFDQLDREITDIYIYQEDDNYVAHILSHYYFIPKSTFSQFPEAYQKKNIQIIYTALYPFFMYKSRALNMIGNKISNGFQAIDSKPAALDWLSRSLYNAPYYRITETNTESGWLTFHSEHDMTSAVQLHGDSGKIATVIIADKLSWTARLINSNLFFISDIMDFIELGSHSSELLYYSSSMMGQSFFKSILFALHNFIEVANHIDHLLPGQISNFTVIQQLRNYLTEASLYNIVEEHHELGFLGLVLLEFTDKYREAGKITPYAAATVGIGIIPSLVHYAYDWREIDNDRIEQLKNKYSED